MTKQRSKYNNAGSALIMTIVLTVLLAIVGTMFLLMARNEKAATSGRSDGEEIKLAVESVVGQIQQTLAADEPNAAKGIEYYDYPGRFAPNGSPDLTNLNDSWLANLEPENIAGIQWRHISDIYNQSPANAYNVPASRCDEYQIAIAIGALADADGDGVADSRWVKIPDVNTSKGKPVYAAVRIVDNGGMLNVNTAYKFEPTLAITPLIPENQIDGSSQMQINLAALAERSSTTFPAERLFNERFNATGGTNIAAPSNTDYQNYITDVVWPIQPTGGHTPFDISDELKLRNRYIINYNKVTTRIEELWDNAYDWGLTTPWDKAMSDPNWFWKTNNCAIDPNKYNYRHISTTYNMDRVIDPYGRKMALLNDPNVSVSQLYDGMLKSYDPNFANIPLTVKEDYAQVAVNIKDYRDGDSNVTEFNANGKTYYGLERPLIYITEMVRNFVTDYNAVPPVTYKSFAIEVYVQLSGGQEPKLIINGTTISGPGSLTGLDGKYYVFRTEAPPALLPVDPNAALPIPSSAVMFDANNIIKLVRDVNGVALVMDSVQVPPWLVDANDGISSYRRDMRTDRWIQRFWDPSNAPQSLGLDNNYASNVPPLQVFLADGVFRNVGDVGLMFRKPAYYPDSNSAAMSNTVGYGGNIPDMRLEQNVRINLADPNVQQMFQYITVFNPNPSGRIKGRININTAPWFVIKQLPWVGLRNGYDANSLAKAIVAYRDKTKIQDFNSTDYANRWAGTSLGAAYGLREIPGFASIGELTTVINQDPNSLANLYSMRYYGLDLVDQAGFPDLTPSDGAANDFEEQNLIFARISDLVTVRSDVFTAYILVRLGDNGPQRRVMAILDRSLAPAGPVRIIAFQPVADAR